MSKLNYEKELQQHIDFEMEEIDIKEAKINDLIDEIHAHYGRPFSPDSLDDIINSLSSAVSCMSNNAN